MGYVNHGRDGATEEMALNRSTYHMKKKDTSTSKGLIPLERDESRTLVSYLRVRQYKFTHIPNETGHSTEAARRAIRMKQEGTSKGFPDYLIIVPTIKGKVLVAIELKRIKGSRTSPEQLEWIDALNECIGTFAYVCYGAKEAIDILEKLNVNVSKSDGNMIF